MTTHAVTYSVTTAEVSAVMEAAERLCAECAAAPPPSWLRRALAWVLYNAPSTLLALLFIAAAFSKTRMPFWYLILVALCGAWTMAAHSERKAREELIREATADGVKWRGTTTLCLADDGIDLRYGDTRVIQAWRACIGTVLTDKHVVLVFADRAAEAVPIAAFSGDDALRGFLRFVTARCAAHRADISTGDAAA